MSIPNPLLSTTAINLRRLVALRNIALACQAFVIWAAVMQFHVSLPLREFVWLIVGMGVANLLTWLRLLGPWPVGEPELFGQLLLDVAAFTGLMYFGGGPTNPFVTLYLLPLALTAAALPERYTWGMAAITAVCYSALMFWYEPLPFDHSGHGDNAMQLHVFGMWAGFILSDAMIAWFAVRMAKTLRERDHLLAQARERELKHERVLALGTLAAGAAHELGTPLATMAVLVKDVKPEQPVPAEKLRILRGQIDRCKQILSSLSAAAGQVRAESGQGRPLDQYLESVFEKWQAMRPGIVVRKHLDGASPAPRIVAEQTLSQAILNVLNNAADVSPHDIDVAASWTDIELTLEVADRGPGFDPEIVQGAGDVIVSTKSEGLGLGLFLAFTTLQRFGGAVRLLNREGGGAACRLTLPLAPLLLPAETAKLV
jgi:two-component system, sensor histidine kinase RegB